MSVEEVPAATLRIGDVIAFADGERMPVDRLAAEDGKIHVTGFRPDRSGHTMAYSPETPVSIVERVNKSNDPVRGYLLGSLVFFAVFALVSASSFFVRSSDRTDPGQFAIATALELGLAAIALAVALRSRK